MIIIGEKINATIPGLKEIIEGRNGEALLNLAVAQASAGADYIDVNVAVDTASRDEEKELMKWAVTLLRDKVDKPLCIDSGDPEVIEAGLIACGGVRCMINSVKAEKENLEEIVPLAAKHDATLIALAMDESGIPKTVEGRLEACSKIAVACEKHNLDLNRIFFDPLVLPVSTDNIQGKVTLETLKRIKDEYPTARTTMGLSNISFGLPSRGRLNEAFLHMSIYAGLDSAIMDPMNERMISAVRTAEALSGKDRHCRKYSRAFRKK